MSTTELTGAEEVAWDLSDLYDGIDDPRIDEHVREVERDAAAFRERYHGNVAALSASELAEAVRERERLDEVLTRAGYYAHLVFSTNMADPARGALLAKLNEKAATLEAQLLFFGLEWVAVDDEHAAAILEDPALDRWRHWLTSQRKYRPYLLSEPEERIFAEKAVSGVSAWSRLFEEQVGALRVELDGEQVSFEAAMSRLYGADRDVRRTAAEAVTAALAPGLRTRTYVFNTILVDKSIDDRLRSYPTWLTARNLSNETTDEAVQALVDVTVSRYDVPQRYYRLKARLLGIERIAYYDRFAPVAEDTRKLSWAEARDLVVGAYTDFAETAGDVVGRFFRDRWIDAPVREDKRTGAFCATNVPGVHPYILMNYTGDRRSVLTLAHELGHGLHGALAQPLGLYNAGTPLTTAETASVFGEALTFKRLLAGEDDPRRRLDLLSGRIEDAIATVFRQVAMNRFEDAMHTARREEGELSTDRFNELWLDSQRQLFADAVDVSGYETWWSYIHHFTASPGYVYAYSYGFLFALSIFHRYELELLRRGGSRSPEELAAGVGLDLTDPSFWASGLEALEHDLGEAERLAEEIGLG
jgi:oligoendopeptidase F